uniref:Uncharacterized protein n=1 Tax=Sphaerodactylus townsendi TaxID=933632 RepID=A0ACB8G9I0_9SAUR
MCTIMIKSICGEGCYSEWDCGAELFPIRLFPMGKKPLLVVISPSKSEKRQEQKVSFFLLWLTTLQGKGGKGAQGGRVKSSCSNNIALIILSHSHRHPPVLAAF